MKRLMIAAVLTIGMLLQPMATDAKSYYKSAKTGRFVTPSYSKGHKSTTYKSFFH